MNMSLVTLGLIFLVAAIVGGRLSAMKWIIPEIPSIGRQLLLAGLGISLVLGGIPPIRDGLLTLAKELYFQSTFMGVGSMVKTANRLRIEYHAVTSGKKAPIPAQAFDHVNELVSDLEVAGSSNGHALYFAGQVKRAEGAVNESHEYFDRYIEHYDNLSPDARSTDTRSDYCYERPDGYCRQRCAWIHQLLAMDFRSEGIRERDIALKLKRFEDALSHAKEAMDEYPGGFDDPEQGIPTKIIKAEMERDIRKIKSQMNAKDPKSKNMLELNDLYSLY